VNTLDLPQVCRYSRANNPAVGRYMATGAAIGGLATFGVGVAFVAINVVGFPEAEIVEAGGLAVCCGGR